MGYWLVVAMAVCAVLAVIAVLAGDAQPEPVPPRRRARPALRWLAAVVTEGQAPADWPTSLRQALPPGVTGTVIELDGRALAARIAAIDAALTETGAGVLLVWCALDDLLAGVSLDEHEQTLQTLLDTTSRHAAVPVVGGLPDLTTWTVAREADLPLDELANLAIRWNASIGRLTHAAGGLFVDLSDLREAELTRDGAVAERFLTPLRRGLVLAHQRAAAFPP
jgi:hypothetical protein